MKFNKLFPTALGITILLTLVLGGCTKEEKVDSKPVIPSFSSEETVKTIEAQSQGDASATDFYLTSIEETEKQIALHVLTEDVYTEMELITFSKGMEYDLHELNNTNKEVLIYIYSSDSELKEKKPYYVYEKNKLYKQDRVSNE